MLTYLSQPDDTDDVTGHGRNLPDTDHETDGTDDVTGHGRTSPRPTGLR
jgi:hypothetical protein